MKSRGLGVVYKRPRRRRAERGGASHGEAKRVRKCRRIVTTRFVWVRRGVDVLVDLGRINCILDTSRRSESDVVVDQTRVLRGPGDVLDACLRGCSPRPSRAPRRRRGASPGPRAALGPGPVEGALLARCLHLRGCVRRRVDISLRLGSLTRVHLLSLDARRGHGRVGRASVPRARAFDARAESAAGGHLRRGRCTIPRARRPGRRRERDDGFLRATRRARPHARGRVRCADFA